MATALLLGRSIRSYLPVVGQELRHPQIGWLAAAVAAELVSMVAFSELQRAMLRATGTTVGARQMLGLTFEANAVGGSLPAGGAFAAAFRVRRLRSWGSPAPAAGFAFVMTGLVSSLAFGALAIVSAWVAGGRSAGAAPAVVAAILLVATVLSARALRRRPAAATRVLVGCSAVVDRVRRRRSEPAESTLSSFVDAVSTIRPTPRNWSAALSWAMINWVADLVCLVAAGNAVSAGAPQLDVIVVAYIAGMSVAGLSLAPGGLGTVEATMIFALGTAGGPHAGAIGSVLLYRLVSYVLMVSIGWTLWLVRRRRSARPASADEPAFRAQDRPPARAGAEDAAALASLRGETAWPGTSATAR